MGFFLFFRESQASFAKTISDMVAEEFISTRPSMVIRKSVSLVEEDDEISAVAASCRCHKPLSRSFSEQKRNELCCEKEEMMLSKKTKKILTKKKEVWGFFLSREERNNGQRLRTSRE